MLSISFFSIKTWLSCRSVPLGHSVNFYFCLLLHWIVIECEVRRRFNRNRCNWFMKKKRILFMRKVSANKDWDKTVCVVNSFPTWHFFSFKAYLLNIYLFGVRNHADLIKEFFHRNVQWKIMRLFNQRTFSIWKKPWLPRNMYTKNSAFF